MQSNKFGLYYDSKMYLQHVNSLTSYCTVLRSQRYTSFPVKRTANKTKLIKFTACFITEK